jgi:uncharacterized membrane protein
MKQFTDDIIQYIKSQFALNTDIEKTVNVEYASKQEYELKCPCVLVQTLDDNDSEQYDTFQGETISNIPLQLTIYGQQMKIANVTRSSQDTVMILTDKVNKMFSKIKLTEWNRNIVRVRRTGTTFSMPLNDGATTYFSPMRYDFYVICDYQNI